MNSLTIAATHNSPSILFNAATGELKISGDSRPENSQGFYEEPIKWLHEFNDYARQNLRAANITLTIALDYFNSSSAKCLFDLILAYNELKKTGHKTTIFWHYETDDEDLLEAGQDLSEMLGIEFDFVPID